MVEPIRKAFEFARLRFRSRNGTGLALKCHQRFRLKLEKENRPVDLATWLPSMLFLGLVGLGLMFAFVIACEKV